MVGVLIILAQGVSILLATAMKILNRDLEIYSNFEDDSAPPHLYTPRVFCGANMGNAVDSPRWFDEIMRICDMEKVCEVAMRWWSLWKAFNNFVWHQKCSTIGAVVHHL
ncbi:hypothetical protein POM88_025535 [Heracleum sosnowskyi]|uniref:Uncharacterized protein n=1 Tax=Heracleum sosnowskyi TaxID=360622 RepID=A0AAD8I577_9APIA|nr:hypothetical protein POM88_025535 [Heracleum sosnowskyi]